MQLYLTPENDSSSLIIILATSCALYTDIKFMHIPLVHIHAWKNYCKWGNKNKKKEGIQENEAIDS